MGRKEALPHRQRRVGPLRNHHEIRRRTRSRTVDSDGSVSTSRSSNGWKTSTGATRRAQSASSPQELLIISAQAMIANSSSPKQKKKKKKKKNTHKKKTPKKFQL